VKADLLNEAKKKKQRQRLNLTLQGFTGMNNSQIKATMTLQKPRE